MKNLVVDIGNSFAKAGLFVNGQVQQTFPQLNADEAYQLICQGNYDALMISSVAGKLADLEEKVARHSHYFLLNASTPLPFHNHYQTPNTLGTDRIAAVAGSLSLFPDQNALAIDAGTCITYDIVDAQKNYWGGSISPGIQMRAKAMHNFTSRLPLVDILHKEIKEVPLAGDSTLSALQSGVLHGTIAEITQMIRMYGDKFGDLQVVICGGDAILLNQGIRTAHNITIVPELILIGLNRILEHNVS
ncbi:type III pantothenate kinase [Catalinimonas alkaloidigena]|uniref:type III pantothenate kinase n=1 Tax=Catalinimonas alkaloidigena TaxID=1075417 RepID=UPI0024061685|nr:type III pantothenate kinase [Catalinimonas alkaloidigena]MDF9799863.1 type III pantothenate kinase [Catalinimonas alkaloidigena]